MLKTNKGRNQGGTKANINGRPLHFVNFLDFAGATTRVPRVEESSCGSGEAGEINVAAIAGNRTASIALPTWRSQSATSSTNPT